MASADITLRLFERLESVERLLVKIEENGRPDDHAVRPIRRREIDGRKITVHIRCNVIQVGDIDNVAQEFKAELYLSARYLEPALRGIRTHRDIDWTQQWDPRIVFPTAVSVDQNLKKAYISDYDENEDAPYVTKSFRVIATFKERLELQDFPIDVQDLNVVVMSDWGEADLEFVKDMHIKDSINTSNFTASQSWQLQPYVLAGPIDSVKDEAGSHQKYPTYQVTFHAKRYVSYYFWNIVFVTAVIMALTFASFAVPPTETGDRLSVTVTLLLTSVAFKFVVSQNLPTISYLTILDMYVLVCLVVQVLIVMQNALSSIWANNPEVSQRFDTISGLVLAAVIVLFHIILAVIIIIKVRKRNQKMHESKASYRRLCEAINADYQIRQQRKRDKEDSPTKITATQRASRHNSRNAVGHSYRLVSE